MKLPDLPPLDEADHARLMQEPLVFHHTNGLQYWCKLARPGDASCGADVTVQGQWGPYMAQLRREWLDSIGMEQLP
jgi:hypothetical protein